MPPPQMATKIGHGPSQPASPRAPKTAITVPLMPTISARHASTLARLALLSVGSPVAPRLTSLTPWDASFVKLLRVTQVWSSHPYNDGRRQAFVKRL